jgi:hypothetical protein
VFRNEPYFFQFFYFQDFTYVFHVVKYSIFFLDYLCREEGIMTFIEAPEQRQNVLMLAITS